MFTLIINEIHMKLIDQKLCDKFMYGTEKEREREKERQRDKAAFSEIKSN